MRNLIVATLLACVAASPTPAQLSGTYTIDSFQPTAGTNYTSFIDAAAALAAQGVIGPVAFLVAPGTGSYAGFSIVNPIAGSSATNTVTFLAVGGVALSGAAAGFTQCIRLGQASVTAATLGPAYIIIDGFDISGATTGAGVIATRCDNITVRACWVHNCGSGIDFNACTNTTIEDNEVYACGVTVGTPGSATYAGGISSYYNNHTCTIQRNKVHDCTNQGIFVGSSGPTTAPATNVVVNNFVWNCPGGGTYPGGIAIRRSGNSTISNNSVWMPAGATVGGIHQMGSSTDPQPLEISNNIVKHDGTGPCFRFETAPTPAAGIFDYNLYDPAPTATVGAVVAVTYATLAAWQAVPNVAGKEVNTLVAPAGFLSSTDLHITPGAAAFNSGVAVAQVTLDIDLQVRPLSGNYDRGADEVPGAGLFASFNAAPVAGPAPHLVQFTDNSFSSDPGGVLTWAWDFQNDGINDSFIQNPAFTYNLTGAYSVKLTVTDASNPASTVVRTNLINVSAGLIANFNGSPLSGTVPLTVAFTDTSFSTGAGGVQTWAWDFQNDGIDDAFIQNPTFTYNCPGSYSVKLTVTDVFSPPSTLIRTNLVTAAPQPFVMTTTGGGVGDLTIIPVGSACYPTAVEGWTLLSFSTAAGAAGTGPFAGLYPDIFTVAYLLTPASPGNPLHFLVNGVTYPDGGAFNLPAGTFSSIAGASMDCIEVLVNGAFGIVRFTNVARVTF